MSFPFALPRKTVLGMARVAGAAGLTITVLTGCLPAQNPVSLRSDELFVTDTYNQVHEFRFSRDSADFDQVELARMDAFLSRAAVGADDIVSVSASGPLGSLRQTKILDALAGRGVHARVVADRLTAPDAVVLLVETPEILPGRCRPSDVPETIDGQNLQLGGCANDHNLARMVVDQNDLVQGKTLGPADGAAMALGIQRYRAGEVTPLREDSTTDE